MAAPYSQQADEVFPYEFEQLWTKGTSIHRRGPGQSARDTAVFTRQCPVRPVGGVLRQASVVANVVPLGTHVRPWQRAFAPTHRLRHGVWGAGAGGAVAILDAVSVEDVVLHRSCIPREDRLCLLLPGR